MFAINYYRNDISMTHKYDIRIIGLARGNIVLDSTPSLLNDEAIQFFSPPENDELCFQTYA
jgi:ABC-type phosphate/phosphonate transport system ATPase subunit